MKTTQMNKMKKSLYVANSIDALEELTKIPNLSAKSALRYLWKAFGLWINKWLNWFKLLLNSIAKSTILVLRQGDDNYINGDEEKAYIFYMKYFQLMESLKKSKEYEKDKVPIRKIIGNNDTVLSYMDRLGSIKDSLLKR